MDKFQIDIASDGVSGIAAQVAGNRLPKSLRWRKETIARRDIRDNLREATLAPSKTFQARFAAVSVIGLALISGCTATNGDLAAQLQAAAEEEVALPDTVEVRPSPNQNTAAAPAPEAVASAEAGAAAPTSQEKMEAVAEAVPDEPVIVASAYAGATPSGASSGEIVHSSALQAAIVPSGIKNVAARSPELDFLIVKYAGHYQVPVELVRRVVNRESTFNPAARNGPYWGLMQIRHDTARTMGYRGTPEGLLDAETNLRYAVKYLRGAFLTADGDHDRAVRLYARGYYYDAKRKGLLRETGLRS